MATLTEQLANIDKSSLDNGSLFSFQIMFDAKKFETLFKSLYTVVVEQAKIIDNLKSTFMTKTEFKTEIQDAKIEIQLLFEDEFRRMDKDIIATKEMNANVGERLGDLDKKIRSHEKSFDDKITTIDQKFDQKLQDAIHDTLSKAGQSNMKALQTQVNERIDQLYNLLELTEESSAKAENDQNANTNHENTAIPNASNQEQITEHQTVNPDIVGMPTKSGSDNTSPISDVEPVLKSLKLSKQPQTAFMSGQKQNSTISDLVIVSSARGPAPRNDDSNSSLLSPDAFNKQRSAIKPEENNAQAKLDSYKRSLKIKTLSKEDIESILEQQQPKEFPEVKAALEETKKMREELALTNKKFSEMKKTVKQKILETIDKKNQEMFEEKFEPFKTRVENMMADKITGDDMNAMLSKKADVMDLNKKPDSETVFRAVKQLEVDVMTKIDQTIIQTDAKLTEKVDKEELNNILSQKFGIPPNMMANAGNGNPILMPQGANLPGGMANQNQLLPRLDLMGQQLESSLPSLSDNRGNNNYPMDLSSELCFCCGTPLASVKNRGAPIPVQTFSMFKPSFGPLQRPTTVGNPMLKTSFKSLNLDPVDWSRYRQKLPSFLRSTLRDSFDAQVIMQAMNNQVLEPLPQEPPKNLEKPKSRGKLRAPPKPNSNINGVLANETPIKDGTYIGVGLGSDVKSSYTQHQDVIGSDGKPYKSYLMRPASPSVVLTTAKQK